MEVMLRRLASKRLQPVDSLLRGMHSEIPPVKSLNPSRLDPYLRASYDP
jgi:hypothetical protein